MGFSQGGQAESFKMLEIAKGRRGASHRQPRIGITISLIR